MDGGAVRVVAGRGQANNNDPVPRPRCDGGSAEPAPRLRAQESPIVPSTRSPRILAAWAQLAWLALAASLWSGVLLGLPMDPDYTSGELLDHLLAWSETGVLYPTVSPGEGLRVLNYPPFLLAAARGLTALGISGLLAGRLVGAGGLLALLGAVAWWARARGARGPVLAGTVGLLGASFPVLYGAGQFHLELWAVGGTVAGFALAARGSATRGALLAGLLLAAACWAKQSQAVPALVALTWVGFHRREAAPAAVTGFLLGAAAGAALVTSAFGGEAWRHMVTYTVGTYSPANLGFQALSHAAPWAVLLVFAALTLRHVPRAGTDALAWYWAASALWSLSATREGSGFAYFLDLHVATALVAGPRLFGGAARGRVWPWLLAAQVVVADVGAGAALAVDLGRVDRVRAALEGVCGAAAVVAAQPAQGAGSGATGARSSPLLTEEAGLARACGRPALLHPFIMTSLARRGLWDPGPFEAALRRGEHGPALLPFDPRAGVHGAQAQRWTTGMLQAFRQAPVHEPAPAGYRVVRW